MDNHRTNVDFGHCSNSTSRLIASTDACFELASIGGPPAPRPGARPGLPRRARAAADMLPVCHFDAQVRPCLCAAGLMCMLRLRAAHSPIDATLLEDVMSFRILSISPSLLILLAIQAVKNRRKVREAARDNGFDSRWPCAMPSRISAAPGMPGFAHHGSQDHMPCPWPGDALLPQPAHRAAAPAHAPHLRPHGTLQHAARTARAPALAPGPTPLALALAPFPCMRARCRLTRVSGRL